MTTSVDAVSGTHRGVGQARAAALVAASMPALLDDTKARKLESAGVRRRVAREIGQ